MQQKCIFFKEYCDVRTIPCKTSDSFARLFNRFVSERKRQIVIEQTQFLSIFVCSESKFENIYTLEYKKKNAQKKEGNMLRI